MPTVQKRIRRGLDGRPELDQQGRPLPWLDRNGEPRWYAQVYVGRHPTTGRVQFVSKSAELKSEVERWLTEQQAMKHSGRRPVTSKETFADYLARWLPVGPYAKL